MTNEIREYDTNGRLIHSRDSDGYEEWFYDDLPEMEYNLGLTSNTD